MKEKPDDTGDRLFNEELVRKMSARWCDDDPEIVARRDAGEVAERHQKTITEALSKLTVHDAQA